MTTNAFLFSWDQHGVEAIIPITQYETTVEDALDVLQGRPILPSPVNNIVNMLLLRARMNSQRHYEVYTIDCTEDLTKEVWQGLWKKDPQFCADIIREKGIKLYCNRVSSDNVRIV